MNELRSWLTETLPGRSWLQHGALLEEPVRFTPLALHAGARRAIHVETHDWSEQQWGSLREACAPDAERLETLHLDPCAGMRFAQAVPSVDVACAMQLFHYPDPYALLCNIARLARRHLVVGSCVMPPDADGLPPGEQVAGFMVHDPRLAAARRMLERRGVALPQFTAQPDGMDALGRPYWHSMWHWFQTEEALVAMVEHLGWRVTQRHASWMDIGVVLVAERG